MASSRLRLKNKTAIVTGGGTKSALAGTGQAIAILFAREGARVLLMDIDETNALKTQETIRKEGGEASVFVGDVTRHEDCRAMVNAAVSRYGCLNILFNNVGISRPGAACRARMGAAVSGRHNLPRDPPPRPASDPLDRRSSG